MQIRHSLSLTVVLAASLSNGACSQTRDGDLWTKAEVPPTPLVVTTVLFKTDKEEVRGQIAIANTSQNDILISKAVIVDICIKSKMLVGDAMVYAPISQNQPDFSGDFNEYVLLKGRCSEVSAKSSVFCTSAVAPLPASAGNAMLVGDVTMWYTYIVPDLSGSRTSKVMVKVADVPIANQP